ncbi:MAG: ATP-binding protein [Desulfobacteraceae bacterium]|nr:ATP-binding protein [Desulfobacteraceae bacterium]
MRIFNTAGPVNCQKHYCLPPLKRVNLEQILLLIEQEKYFVLHAPRQTGKTTCLLALMDHINRGNKYACLYINVEKGQSAREDVARGIRATLGELASRARDFLEDDFPLRHMNEILQQWGEDSAFNELLSQWSREISKPLVLLVDEIDSLIGDTLISVLRQIRSGYDKRPMRFPQSVVLCGVRDVRDYRIHSDREKTIITGGSAFNIKAESLRLGDFEKAEVIALLEQHHAETGQKFEPEAEELMWRYTRGQPWLVNALAYEVCFKMKEGRDRSRPVTTEMLMEAKEHIIRSRVTHLDQLVDKLQEERVRRVIEPILAGDVLAQSFKKDDVQYVLDLGLIRQGRNGEVKLSNSIYQEIIPRELVWNIQSGMTVQGSWYVRENGRLDVNKLMGAFQEFFREHSEHWVERFQYKEAGPQLLMQAFLQRIVNTGGRIEREYGLGRMRTDLLVIWPHPDGVQKVVIELKILYKGLKQTLRTGLQQTWEYMDRSGTGEGHLVIFDRDPEKSWEEKIFERKEQYDGHQITVWGM